MSASPNLRFLLAATTLLVLFACAYEAAVQWPVQLPAAATHVIISDTVTDTASLTGLASNSLRPTPTTPTRPPDTQSTTAAALDTTRHSLPPVDPIDDPEDCPPQPLHFSRLRTGPVFHHYTGTMGTEHVSVELSWTRPDSITGHFYYWRGGPEYQLSYYGRHQGPFVFSVRQDEAYYQPKKGTWHLRQPPGPVLRGFWLDSAGQRRCFVLREDYHQSVPYDIQTLKLSGGQSTSDNCFGSSLTRDYLHLRGALPPALQRVQAPALASRKRQLLTTYERAGDIAYYLSIRLNDFNLLSYQTFYEAMHVGPRQNGFENGLFDLTTGHSLPLASQLQPGYELALRCLFTNHLRRDFGLAAIPPNQPVDPERLLELPTLNGVDFIGLALTGAGLEGSYLPADIYGVLGPEAEVNSIPYPLLISYRELRPLVRPGTPLARMLAARALW